MQTIILVGTCKCSFIEQFYTMICTCIVKCLLYVTEHEKTGLMYTKYISLYYGTYLLYCLRY